MIDQKVLNGALINTLGHLKNVQHFWQMARIFGRSSLLFLGGEHRSKICNVKMYDAKFNKRRIWANER